MGRTRELAKNTIIILASKFCTQFISFLILPIYTSRLSSSEYGTVDLISTYTSLAIPIISIQLEMATFRFLIDNRKNKAAQKEIISSSILTIAAIAVPSSLIYFTVASVLNLDYALLILLNICSTMFSSYLLQVSRGLGDNITYSLGSLLTGLSVICLNLVFILLLNMGVDGILLSSIIANSINIVFIIARNKIHKLIAIKSYKKGVTKKLIKYSLPLVPNSLIWWIINASDRTIISLFMDISSNGIYAISNKFSTIIVQFYGVFILSWTESSSIHINDSDGESFFNKIFDATIRIFSCMSLLLIALMPFIFNILIKNEYSESYQYIPILVIGTFFNVIASFMGAIYVAKKKTSQIAKSSLYAGIINIAINAILIRFIGLWAAAISTMISFMVMAIYRHIDIQKYMKIKINYRLLIILFSLFTVCIATYYTGNTVVHIINAIIITSVSLALNKTTIRLIYKNLRIKLIG